jgi:hypothetical protein
MKAYSKVKNFYQKFRRKASDYFQLLSRRTRRPSLAQTQSEDGQVIVLALIFLIMATTLITIGMRLTSNSSKTSHSQQLVVAEAESVAQAGIQDALGWFVARNNVMDYSQIYRPGQSVTFASGVSYVDQISQAGMTYSANPQQSYTIDQSVPATAIINEYPLDNQNPSLATNFARYVVPIQPYGTPTPAAMHDVSGSRGISMLNGDGQVWSVTSIGYVYQRNSFTGTYPLWTVPYNSAPNKILASAKVTSEFRKLGLSMPTTNTTSIVGAVYCDSTTQVILSDSNTKLSGAVSATGNYAVVAMNQTAGACPTPVGDDGENVTPAGTGGCNCFGTSQSLLLSASSVFGMTLSSVQNIADYTCSSTTAPVSFSNNSLIYFSGSVTYGSSSASPFQALDTNGSIVVVNGDLILNPGSSLITGVLFVTGNLTVGAGDVIDGTVIMGTPYYHGSAGTLTMSGSSSGAFGEIFYQPELVTAASQKVATYKEDLSERQSYLTIPNW